MKWRIPIMSLYVALLSIMGAGLLGNFADANHISKVTHFERNHKHNSRLHLSEKFYTDNTEEDDHESFVGYISPLSLLNNSLLNYTPETFKRPSDKGIVETKRFLLFRSILI